MVTQKRRVVYLSDEEWALLGAQAREHRRSISQVIRDMWQLSATGDPADPAARARVIAAATKTLGHDPYRDTARKVVHRRVRTGIKMGAEEILTPEPVMTNAVAGPQTATPRGVSSYSSRPFTPVPKAGKKK